MFKKIVYILVLSTVLFASEFSIKFDEYKINNFNPSTKQVFQVPFTLSHKADVSLKIYTHEGYLINTIKEKSLKQGKNTLSWDGKDFKGNIVPNEAYYVVLESTYKGKKFVLDTRTMDGGLVQIETQAKFDEDGRLQYKLDKPSRVLIRIGIEYGPMLVSLSNWEVRNKGKNIQHWDGFNKDKNLNIRELANYSAIVSSYSLPPNSILVEGGNENYLEYLSTNFNTKANFDSIKKRITNSNTNLISPYYTRTKLSLKDPEIEIIFPKNIKQDEDGVYILSHKNPIPVKVALTNLDDEKRFEMNKFEVTVYNNFEFISEEESGYIPITWLWKPEKKKGLHTFTVNIISFEGHVGTKSIRYKIQ